MQSEIRKALQNFQDGYTERQIENLDNFMKLFVDSDDIEMIGVGASRRGGNEWFQGVKQIKEIIESDWKFWGDVRINIDGAKITSQGETAWLTTDGKLIASSEFEKALPFYLDQMKELLENEEKNLETRLMESTHFGLGRIRDVLFGKGYAWPFVFTAVLVKQKNSWAFHTIHWSFPAD
ncbi:MAG: nuclear transport factor 2 family protein [Anaerolineaceae bacterium]|nr:nuclear transport factor 2 family protein [Anaerolineaceae bacterium]